MCVRMCISEFQAISDAHNASLCAVEILLTLMKCHFMAVTDFRVNKYTMHPDATI